MILMLAGLALADPVAQRAPVAGQVVAVAGAPHQAVAVRPTSEDETGPQPVVSIGIRVPSAATDVSVGLWQQGGPAVRDGQGWGWAAGASVGVIGVRGPSVALSAAPWARVERRGKVHGGAQLALPLAGHLTDGLRIPLVGELFIGGQRGRLDVVALGGAGWAWTTGTPAGSLVVHGTIQVGVRLD